jgi:hypothetical protein
VIHMRWHKDGERKNKEVMVHPSDSDAWKSMKKDKKLTIMKSFNRFWSSVLRGTKN